MTFDGVRALTIGDYVTPRTGAHAGQLGPWTYVVSAVGIPPRSTAMKVVFIGFGLSWLVIAFASWRGESWASNAMIAFAAATLWYLPVGTVVGLVQIAMLLWLRRTA